jgi:hypothetical protein
MSAAVGLGGFASGLAGGLQTGIDRKERQADRALQQQMMQQVANQPRGAIPQQAWPSGAQAPDIVDIPNGSAGSDVLTGSAGDDRLGAPARGTGRSAMAPFLPLLDKHEGGGRYDTLFGHAQRNDSPFKGVDVTQMTLGELRQFTDPKGEYGQWVRGQVGRVATPMGRHQIVGTTLRNAAKTMGLSDDTRFTPAVQDDIAAHLARQRLSRASSMEGKIRGLRAEWEGFKHVSDNDLAAAIQQFEASA